MFQRWASDVAWGRPLPIHADQRERVTKLRDLAKRARRWVLSLGEDDPARVRLLKHGEDLEREAADLVAQSPTKDLARLQVPGYIEPGNVGLATRAHRAAEAAVPAQPHPLSEAGGA